MNTNMTCIKACSIYTVSSRGILPVLCISAEAAGFIKQDVLRLFNRACNSCVYAGSFCLDVLLRLPYHYLHIAMTKGSAYSSDYSKLVHAETGCTPYK